MTILITGVAGFIGFHVAGALLARGESVVGVDCLTPYYDVALKEARLARLREQQGFRFYPLNVADEEAILNLGLTNPDITEIIHLAAQAGVRYSLENPLAYITANVRGQTVMLEMARRLEHLRHFVYASSSSVYGGNTKLPFSVDDPVDHPVSLYAAATKRSAELISYTYGHLYGLPQNGSALLHGLWSMGAARYGLL